MTGYRLAAYGRQPFAVFRTAETQRTPSLLCDLSASAVNPLDFTAGPIRILP